MLAREDVERLPGDRLDQLPEDDVPDVAVRERGARIVRRRERVDAPERLRAAAAVVGEGVVGDQAARVEEELLDGDRLLAVRRERREVARDRRAELELALLREQVDARRRRHDLGEGREVEHGVDGHGALVRLFAAEAVGAGKATASPWTTATTAPATSPRATAPCAASSMVRVVEGGAVEAADAAGAADDEGSGGGAASTGGGGGAAVTPAEGGRRGARPGRRRGGGAPAGGQEDGEGEEGRAHGGGARRPSRAGLLHPRSRAQRNPRSSLRATSTLAPSSAVGWRKLGPRVAR